MRETDIDGDAAALFLFQAIGVDASEGLYQRGLSVVDVSRGADDDRLHSDSIVGGSGTIVRGRKVAPGATCENTSRCSTEVAKSCRNIDPRAAVGRKNPTH